MRVGRAGCGVAQRCGSVSVSAAGEADPALRRVDERGGADAAGGVDESR